MWAMGCGKNWAENAAYVVVRWSAWWARWAVERSFRSRNYTEGREAREEGRVDRPRDGRTSQFQAKRRKVLPARTLVCQAVSAPPFWAVISPIDKYGVDEQTGREGLRRGSERMATAVVAKTFRSGESGVWSQRWLFRLPGSTN